MYLFKLNKQTQNSIDNEQVSNIDCKLENISSVQNCCTRTGSHVEEPRCEDSSDPLYEVVVHGGTNSRNVEHLGVNEEKEEYKFWVAPLNGQDDM